MIVLLFLLGLAFYVAQVLATYHLRESQAIYAVGPALAAITMLCWYGVVRRIPVDAIYWHAAVWDTMAAATFLIAPVLLFSIPLTAKSLAGIGLMIAGCLLLR